MWGVRCIDLVVLIYELIVECGLCIVIGVLLDDFFVVGDLLVVEIFLVVLYLLVF